MSDFRFKKRYGQNFLKDKNILDKIALLAKSEDNSLVMEIGPGDGRLTKKLCDLYDNVLCYEIDHDVIIELNNNLKIFNNYKVIEGDFLEEDVIKDLNEFNYKNLYVVANIPYYITTAIILKLINLKLDYKNVILMVQKEVGERFTSLPGSKTYSSISVYLQYYFKIKKEFIVSRSSFVPEPNVDSVVLSFLPRDLSNTVKDERVFLKLVRDSFQYKRKTIRNNLKDYDLKIVEDVLKKYGFDLSVRAEMLSLDVFIAIANEL